MAIVSKLAQGLQGVFEKINKTTIVDEKILKESIKELQRTLISGDVNVKLVLGLTKSVEEKMKSPPNNMSQKDYLVKIIYEELVSLMGEAHVPKIQPQKILLVGTYGHGKTTTTSKLAKFYSKRGLKVAMISTDTWRPAAYEQLKQLGEKIKVPAYGEPGNKNAVEILKNGMRKFEGYDVVIVDSAGRDSLNHDLIKEIGELSKEFQPDEKYLILGADMGQTAGKQAKEFNDEINLTGVIVTRMDSSAKGGGALSACAEANVPCTFIGVGEKVDDFEVYDGKKFIGKLLGFPDLETLLERAKEVTQEEGFSEEELMKGDFNLKKFYQQIEATKKMGSIEKIMEQLGIGAKIPKEFAEQSEEKMLSYKVIIDSMTEKERLDPDVISSNRIKRISQGSGRTEQEVRELLKQFNMTKKMFKKFKKGRRMPKNLDKMMKGFGMK